MATNSVSVIIPTYNRQKYLRQTLDSLAQQSWPADCFEVIVVDDGSMDGPTKIAASYPFSLRYYRQTNQGDAAARNNGARQSRADLLVFLDDDMLAAPNYLAQLVAAHRLRQNSIIVGTAHLWLEESNPLDNAPSPLAGDDPLVADDLVADRLVAMPFADVCSNNMSLSREAYFATGLMNNLGFSGSSIWCDVDFAYRAYQRGMAFYRSATAVCWHRDYVAQSLDSRSKRSREAAYRAAVLLQRHPGLLPHLPMFTDKTPIVWGQDSPRLIGRKLARRVTSSRPALWGVEQLAGVIEKSSLSPTLLDPLSRWIVGGHLFQGYREGLRDPRSTRRCTKIIS